MNMIRNKILQLRKDSALSWESWAEQSNRSVETLKKQMQEDANPTLSTMVGIVAPLHASVEILTDDEKKRLAQYDDLVARIAELESLLFEERHDRELMTMQIDALTKTTEQMQDLIDRLRRSITRKEASIERKEAVIARKDSIISSLLRKSGVI